MGDGPQPVFLDSVDHRVARPAEPRGALGNGVEHWLDVGGRAADHPQDFARRRLLLEGCLFRLVEEAHVLDCDQRLIGERLHQGDLPIAERTHFPPPRGDDPDQLGVPQHGHRQDRPRVFKTVSRRRHPLRVGKNIGDVHDPALESGPPGRRLAAWADAAAVQVCGELRRRVLVRGGVEELAVPQEKRGDVGIAEPRHVGEDRVVDGLEVGRRARDDPQHLAGGRLLLERLG